MVSSFRFDRPIATRPAQVSDLALATQSAYRRVSVASTRFEAYLERQTQPRCFLDFLDRYGNLLFDLDIWGRCFGAGWLSFETSLRHSGFVQHFLLKLYFLCNDSPDVSFWLAQKRRFSTERAMDTFVFAQFQIRISTQANRSKPQDFRRDERRFHARCYMVESQ